MSVMEINEIYNKRQVIDDLLSLYAFQAYYSDETAGPFNTGKSVMAILQKVIFSRSISVDTLDWEKDDDALSVFCMVVAMLSLMYLVSVDSLYAFFKYCHTVKSDEVKYDLECDAVRKIIINGDIKCSDLINVFSQTEDKNFVEFNGTCDPFYYNGHVLYRYCAMFYYFYPLYSICLTGEKYKTGFRLFQYFRNLMLAMACSMREEISDRIFTIILNALEPYVGFDLSQVMQSLDFDKQFREFCSHADKCVAEVEASGC